MKIILVDYFWGWLATSICLVLVLVRGDVRSYLGSLDLLQLDFPNTILLVSFCLSINLHYRRVCRYLGALLCSPSLSRDVPTRAYWTDLDEYPEPPLATWWREPWSELLSPRQSVIITFLELLTHLFFCSTQLSPPPHQCISPLLCLLSCRMGLDGHNFDWFWGRCYAICALVDVLR